LRAALEALADGAPRGERVAEARRAVGLATINGDASFQRLLSESPGDEGLLEPTMALLTYNRRFTRGVTALLSTHRAPDALEERGAVAVEALGTLADALEAGEPPPPLPSSFDAASSTPLDGAMRRLRMMHEAASRLAAPHE